MKNLFLLFMLIVGSIAGQAQQVWTGMVAEAYESGNGTAASPYTIATAEQLAKLAKDVNEVANWSKGKHFKLTANIVLNQNVLNNGALNTSGKHKEWPVIGYFNSATDYRAFQGEFDGDGHTISGIYINNSNTYIGLFRMAESAIIKNMGITDSYVYANANIGAVAGFVRDSKVLNCYNAGRVDGYGSYHGGIVGLSSGNSLVANCYNYGVVAGKNNIGGIVGRNGEGTLSASEIRNCFNRGVVTSTGTNRGGITPENNVGCKVTNCYFVSAITPLGIMTNKGTTENMLGNTVEDLLGDDFLAMLNNDSKLISLACRWVKGEASPQHNYAEFTEENSEEVNPFKMATGPIPEDGDIHADADSGFCILRWEAAPFGNVKSHSLYLGTDSLAVANATTTSTILYKGTFASKDTSYKVENLYSMNTYYWRVDETDSGNVVVKGKIWSFRPRQLAFRGAEGYGRFATGGRGGKVVYVTNLNDSGAGSLREALTKSIGPRTVVFKVSGIIKLNSRLIITDKFVTIAGQTAPGKGICIAGAPLGLASESITRFLRVRLGAGTTYDGMGMASNNNTIADHCTVGWTIDEAFSSRNAKNITLQRTIISEALNVAGHSNYPAGKAHGFAASIGGDVGSFHHNLLAHCSGRNWSMAGGVDASAAYTGRLDIRNNVVYNWHKRTTDGGAMEVNFVNNYYKPGAASDNFYAITAQHENNALGGRQQYYVSGNVMPGYFDESNQAKGRAIQGSVAYETFVNEPFFESYVTTQTAFEAYKNVLSDVGCTMPMPDNHDKRIVRETLTGTYSSKGSVSGLPGLPDHQNDVGGYENYPEETRTENFDSDMDGLPDWWEKLFGSSENSAPDDFSDANADPDIDGYTALEDYLEWMSVPHFFLTPNISDTIELSGYVAGYSNPAYNSGPVQGFTLKFSGSSVIITPTLSQPGITYIDIKATDSQGSTFIRRLGVCIGADKTLTNKGAIEADTHCKVYPSVFDKLLNIEMTNAKKGAIEIILCDLTGRTILQQSYGLNDGYNRFSLECPSSLPKQIYVLKISDAKSGAPIDTQRLIRK